MPSNGRHQRAPLCFASQVVYIVSALCYLDYYLEQDYREIRLYLDLKIYCF